MTQDPVLGVEDGGVGKAWDLPRPVPRRVQVTEVASLHPAVTGGNELAFTKA